MKKLILSLFIFIFFNSFAYSKIMEAKYKISYGSFLNLGVATASLQINKNTYKIKIQAKTTGTAKYLTNNRIEIYESFGEIVNNNFIPYKFIKTKKDKYKLRIKEYTFNHKEKKIYVNTINKGLKKKLKNDFKFDYEEFYQETTEESKYYAKDDLLSLFFDINKKLLNFTSGKEYSLKAVGANKKNGIINVIIPKNEKLDTLQKALNTKNEKKFIAFINQKIFGSQRGELFLSINKDGFCTKAILKDVILFGDIVGEMIEFKIKKG